MAEDADLGIEGLEQPEAVGRGGFSVVYRAWQPTFHRTVAVKVIDVRLDEQAAGRFERECTTMGQLSEHPAIVTVLDAGFTTDGRPWLAMPFLSGGSLQDRLDRDTPFSWQEMLDVGIRLCGALSAAHDAGVLHRDLKPANVMLTRYGEAMLSDFGIARVAGGPETTSGVVTASVTHAAPEILDGARPTVASDVYSLGSTLYALVRGDAAFAVDTDESLLPLLRRVMLDPVPDLRPSGVPDDVCAVLEQAMAKDPAERQASVTDLGRALQDCQRRHELTVTRMITSEAAGTPGAQSGQGLARNDAAEHGAVEQAGAAHAGAAPTGDADQDAATVTAAVGGPPTTTGRGGPADAAGSAPDSTPAPPPSEPAPRGPSRGRRLLVGLAALGAAVLAGVVVWQLAFGGAGGLAFGDQLDGQIVQAGAADRHTLTAAAGDMFAIRLRSTDLDSLLRLRDAEGVLVAQDDDSGGGEHGTDALMLGSFPHAGRYEIEATSSDDATGSYTLTVAGGQPVALGLDEPARDSFDDPGDIDFYSFEASTDDVLVLRMAAEGTVLDSFLRLYGPDGETFVEDDDSGGGRVGLDALIVLHAPADGTYVAAAMPRHAGTVGRYELTLQQPVPVQAGEPVDGSINREGQIDLYALAVSAGQRYEIRMGSETLDSHLVAFDPRGHPAAEDGDSGGGVNDADARIVGEPSVDGIVVVVARSQDPDGVGPYRLEIARSG